MSGSYKHCTNDDWTFRGIDLLDHMGDAHGALAQMHWMIWFLAESDTAKIEHAMEAHYASLRQQPPPQPCQGCGRPEHPGECKPVILQVHSDPVVQALRDVVDQLKNLTGAVVMADVSRGAPGR